MHTVFNEAMGRWAAITVAASPASLAYTTTETGLVTVALMIMLSWSMLTFDRRTFRTGEEISRAQLDPHSTYSPARSRW